MRGDKQIVATLNKLKSSIIHKFSYTSTENLLCKAEKKRREGVTLPHPSLEVKKTLGSTIKRYRKISGKENILDPTAENLIEVVLLQNIYQEISINSIKGLGNIHFEGHVTIEGFIVQMVNSFKSSADAVLYVSPFNETLLLRRDKRRHEHN